MNGPTRILATTDAGNTWNAYNTPLFSSPSAGGLSVAFRDASHGIVGGGDLAVNYRIQAATTQDGGHTRTFTKQAPLGGTVGLAYAQGMTLGAAEATDHSFDRTVVITAETAPDFSSRSGGVDSRRRPNVVQGEWRQRILGNCICRPARWVARRQ